MVKKFLSYLNEKLHKRSKKPWASFEITDFLEDGRVEVHFKWNPAFINMIYSLGFQAETEEDSVMLFFYTSQMGPHLLTGEEPVQSDEHPTLTSPSNIMRT